MNTIDIDDTVSTEIEELASPVSVESVSPAASVTGYEGGEEHAVSVVIDDEMDKVEMSLLKKFKLVALNPFTWVLAIHQFCVNTIQLIHTCLSCNICPCMKSICVCMSI